MTHDKQMGSRAELEMFIRKHIPSGWVGPIRDFDFTPLISEEEFVMIQNGKIPVGKDFNKWYIKEAIEAWHKKNL